MRLIFGFSIIMIDGCIYKATRIQGLACIYVQITFDCSIGISLRAMGFRVDAGCPVDLASISTLWSSLKEPPRIYLGLDQEL